MDYAYGMKQDISTTRHRTGGPPTSPDPRAAPHPPPSAVLAQSKATTGEFLKPALPSDEFYAKLLRMPTTSTPTPINIKEYLRKIGSKGGKKSAQHPDRPRLNRDAAIARWRGRMPKPKEIPK